MDMKGFGERFGLRFDHVGCAVNDLERISEFYDGLGYSLGETTDCPEMRQRMRTIEKDGFRLELLSPYGGTRAGLQHTAYMCSDVEGACREAGEAGCRIVVPVTRHNSRRFAFIQDPDGIYVEFMQDDEGGRE